MRYSIFAGIGVLALLLTACQGATATPTPAPAPTKNATIAPTPLPTVTPAPTPTRQPSPTPIATSTPAPVATPTVAPASAPGELPDAALLVKQAGEAMSKVRTFHLAGSLTAVQDGPDPLMQATLDGALEVGGDFQLVITLKMRIQGMSVEAPVELRGIDGVSYFKNPITGTWEVDEDSGAFDAFQDLQLIGESLEQEFSLREARVTLETVGGLEMYRIRGQTLEDGQMSDVQIWIEKESKLLRRVREDRLAPASDYQQFIPGAFGDVRETEDIALDGFNEPVRIEPVQLPPPSNPGGFGTFPILGSGTPIP